MRDYSKVSPRFWTGETGRQIRTLGRDAQVIAFYVFTSPSANMLGLYYLALPTLCHETGSSLEGARKALRSLSEVGFAHYDEGSEHIFVPNMAREQIGERLKAKDNRHVAVLKELEQLRKIPFFNDFLDKYREAFELHCVEPSKPLRSPFEVPSKPLRSQEQEQEQEQEQKQEQDLVPSEPVALERATAAREAGAVEKVFAHWQQVHRKPRAQLDEKRRALIRKALKHYSEADLCQSISGYLNSPHHMGTDPKGNGTVYDAIELFLRDSAHIDAGLKFYTEPPRTDLSGHTRRNIAATIGWIPPELRNHANK